MSNTTANMHVNVINVITLNEWHVKAYCSSKWPSIHIHKRFGHYLSDSHILTLHHLWVDWRGGEMQVSMIPGKTLLQLSNGSTIPWTQCWSKRMCSTWPVLSAQKCEKVYAWGGNYWSVTVIEATALAWLGNARLIKLRMVARTAWYKFKVMVAVSKFWVLGIWR